MMIKTVTILNKMNFDAIMKQTAINDDNVENYIGNIFISIINGDDTPYFKSNHKNVLNLIFDDVTDQEEDKDNIQFNDEHADMIIKFMEDNSEFIGCYVHCAAGWSRSGAVGTFINDFYAHENYFDFMARNKTIKPNFHILSKLKAKYNGENDNKNDSGGQ